MDTNYMDLTNEKYFPTALFALFFAKYFVGANTKDPNLSDVQKTSYGLTMKDMLMSKLYILCKYILIFY